MNRSPYLNTPFRSLSEAAAPRFHYSLGMLVDPRDCRPSVFYRSPTRAEKREAVRAVVSFNLKRGNCGQLRFNAVLEAVRGSASRTAFRAAYASARDRLAVA